MKTRLTASEEQLRRLREEERLLKEEEEKIKKLHKAVDGIDPFAFGVTSRGE